MDKVDNRKIECMVCANCIFPADDRKNGRRIRRKSEETTGKNRNIKNDDFMYEMLKLYEIIE